MNPIIRKPKKEFFLLFLIVLCFSLVTNYASAVEVISKAGQIPSDPPCEEEIFTVDTGAPTQTPTVETPSTQYEEKIVVIGTTSQVGVTTSIVSDPSEHSQYIGPLGSILPIVTKSETITISNILPDIVLTGPISADGTFTAYGVGTVADHSNIGVSMAGTYKDGKLVSTVIMGVNGELPTGKSTTYSVSGQGEVQVQTKTITTQMPSTTPDVPLVPSEPTVPSIGPKIAVDSVVTIPSDLTVGKEFTISAKVVNNGDVQGSKKIRASLSHLQNGQVTTLNLPAQTISLDGGSAGFLVWPGQSMSAPGTIQVEIGCVNVTFQIAQLAEESPPIVKEPPVVTPPVVITEPNKPVAINDIPPEGNLMDEFQKQLSDKNKDAPQGEKTDDESGTVITIVFTAAGAAGTGIAIKVALSRGKKPKDEYIPNKPTTSSPMGETQILDKKPPTLPSSTQRNDVLNLSPMNTTSMSVPQVGKKSVDSSPPKISTGETTQADLTKSQVPPNVDSPQLAPDNKNTDTKLNSDSDQGDDFTNSPDDESDTGSESVEISDEPPDVPHPRTGEGPKPPPPKIGTATSDEKPMYNFWAVAVNECTPEEIESQGEKCQEEISTDPYTGEYNRLKLDKENYDKGTLKHNKSLVKYKGGIRIFEGLLSNYSDALKAYESNNVPGKGVVSKTAMANWFEVLSTAAQQLNDMLAELRKSFKELLARYEEFPEKLKSFETSKNTLIKTITDKVIPHYRCNHIPADKLIGKISSLKLKEPDKPEPNPPDRVRAPSPPANVPGGGGGGGALAAAGGHPRTQEREKSWCRDDISAKTSYEPLDVEILFDRISHAGGRGLDDKSVSNLPIQSEGANDSNNQYYFGGTINKKEIQQVLEDDLKAYDIVEKHHARNDSAIWLYAFGTKIMNLDLKVTRSKGGGGSEDSQTPLFAENTNLALGNIEYSWILDELEIIDKNPKIDKTVPPEVSFVGGIFDPVKRVWTSTGPCALLKINFARNYRSWKENDVVTEGRLVDFIAKIRCIAQQDNSVMKGADIQSITKNITIKAEGVKRRYYDKGKPDKEYTIDDYEYSFSYDPPYKKVEMKKRITHLDCKEETRFDWHLDEKIHVDSGEFLLVGPDVRPVSKFLLQHKGNATCLGDQLKLGSQGTIKGLVEYVQNDSHYSAVDGRKFAMEGGTNYNEAVEQLARTEYSFNTNVDTRWETQWIRGDKKASNFKFTNHGDAHWRSEQKKLQGFASWNGPSVLATIAPDVDEETVFELKCVASTQLLKTTNTDTRTITVIVTPLDVIEWWKKLCDISFSHAEKIFDLFAKNPVSITGKTDGGPTAIANSIFKLKYLEKIKAESDPAANPINFVNAHRAFKPFVEAMNLGEIYGDWYRFYKSDLKTANGLFGTMTYRRARRIWSKSIDMNVPDRHTPDWEVTEHLGDILDADQFKKIVKEHYNYAINDKELENAKDPGKVKNVVKEAIPGTYIYPAYTSVWLSSIGHKAREPVVNIDYKLEIKNKGEFLLRLTFTYSLDKENNLILKDLVQGPTRILAGEQIMELHGNWSKDGESYKPLEHTNIQFSRTGVQLEPVDGPSGLKLHDEDIRYFTKALEKTREKIFKIDPKLCEEISIIELTGDCSNIARKHIPNLPDNAPLDPKIAFSDIDCTLNPRNLTSKGMAAKKLFYEIFEEIYREGNHPGTKDSGLSIYSKFGGCFNDDISRVGFDKKYKNLMYIFEDIEYFRFKDGKLERVPIPERNAIIKKLGGPISPKLVADWIENEVLKKHANDHKVKWLAKVAAVLESTHFEHNLSKVEGVADFMQKMKTLGKHSFEEKRVDTKLTTNLGTGKSITSSIKGSYRNFNNNDMKRFFMYLLEPSEPKGIYRAKYLFPWPPLCRILSGTSRGHIAKNTMVEIKKGSKTAINYGMSKFGKIDAGFAFLNACQALNEWYRTGRIEIGIIMFFKAVYHQAVDKFKWEMGTLVGSEVFGSGVTAFYQYVSGLTLKEAAEKGASAALKAVKGANVLGWIITIVDLGLMANDYFLKLKQDKDLEVTLFTNPGLYHDEMRQKKNKCVRSSRGAQYVLNDDPKTYPFWCMKERGIKLEFEDGSILETGDEVIGPRKAGQSRECNWVPDAILKELPELPYDEMLYIREGDENDPGIGYSINRNADYFMPPGWKGHFSDDVTLPSIPTGFGNIGGPWHFSWQGTGSDGALKYSPWFTSMSFPPDVSEKGKIEEMRDRYFWTNFVERESPIKKVTRIPVIPPITLPDGSFLSVENVERLTDEECACYLWAKWHHRYATTWFRIKTADGAISYYWKDWKGNWGQKSFASEDDEQDELPKVKLTQLQPMK